MWNGEIHLIKAENSITIRDLFTMTAGLSYDLDTPSIRSVKEKTQDKCSTRELIRAIAKDPLLFEPGQSCLKRSDDHIPDGRQSEQDGALDFIPRCTMRFYLLLSLLGRYYEMKVLAIVGSPRRNGNTAKAVQRVKDLLIGIDKSIDFETVHLQDYDLRMCTGCFTCFAKGEDKCALNDDLGVLKGRMDEADGIILAAPTYAMGCPGMMKNFIDRLAYTSHRPCYFDKAFLAVSTIGGFIGLKQTMEQLSLLASGGKSLIRLGIMCPPVNLAGNEKRAHKKTIKAATAFYRSMKKDTRKVPGLADWAYFSSFKAFASIDSYQRTSPADCAYYMDKEYFYPVQGHPFSNLLGKTMKRLFKISLKLMVRE